MKKQLILLSLYTAFIVLLSLPAQAQSCTDIVVTLHPTSHPTYFQIDGYGQNSDTVSYYGMQEREWQGGAWHNIVPLTSLHDLCTGFAFTFLKMKATMPNGKKFSYRMVLVTASGNTLYGNVFTIQKKGTVCNSLALASENRSDIKTEIQMSQSQMLKDAGIESGGGFASKVIFSGDLPTETESDATEKVMNPGNEVSPTSQVEIEVAGQRVTVRNPLVKPYTFRLTSIMGQLIAEESFSQVGPEHTWNLESLDLAPGVYIITTIDSQNAVETRKIQIN